MKFVVLLLGILAILSKSEAQNIGLGKLQEVFAWKQLTYDINGHLLNSDRRSADGLPIQGGNRRQHDTVYFANGDHKHSWNNNDANSYFIQYNNVPMGAERVGNRLFVTVPRRRYGIPSTLNYIDLTQDTSKSPSLKPYPSIRQAGSLTSVYKTRADACGRLWMVDTGLLEIPNNLQQIRQPSIVVFDHRSDTQILRYELKESDLPANNTPAGLASITLDTSNGCTNTFAYIADLMSFGIIVYSLKENNSWRVTHNYMHFNPLATTLQIAGQRFQWNDGIFSIALGGTGRCKTAYFHPLMSTQEFSVSTCVLNNKTASNDNEYWTRFNVLGERGPNAQSTMHAMHSSGVLFYADVGRDAVSCWNTQQDLEPAKTAVLARDDRRLSYPADLHITGDEVWVISNSMPRFSYSRLNTDEYNFFIYKGNVQDLISGTVCAGTVSSTNNNKYYNRNNRYKSRYH